MRGGSPVAGGALVVSGLGNILGLAGLAFGGGFLSLGAVWLIGGSSLVYAAIKFVESLELHEYSRVVRSGLEEGGAWFPIYASADERARVDTICKAVALLKKGSNTKANFDYLFARRIPMNLYPALLDGFVPPGTPEPEHPIPTGYDKLQ